MAALCSDYRNKRILVKNIPPNVKYDKLVIHFQREKHGGSGDVVSITFPKSKSEPDQAVVEFENHETMLSVLQHNHIVAGQQMNVHEFPKQPLGKSNVVISDAATAKLLTISGCYDMITESTGVSISAQHQEYHIMGEWYQVMAAVQRIEQIVALDKLGDPSANSATSSGAESQNLSVKDAGGMTSDATNSVAVVVSKISESLQRQKSCEDTNREIKQAVDDNVFAYLKICHPELCKTLGRKYKVKFRDERSYVCFVPTSKTSSTGVTGASHQFRAYYSHFLSKIHTRYFDLEDLRGVAKKEIDEAVSLLNENKKVFIGKKRKNEREVLVFLTMSKDDAESAVASFRNMFAPDNAVELAKIKVSGSALNVSIIHGDYRKEKTEAVISENDLFGDGILLSDCSAGVKDDVNRWLRTIKPAAWNNPVHITRADLSLGCKSIIHYYLNDRLPLEESVEKSLLMCLEFAHDRRLPSITLPAKLLGSGVKNFDLYLAIFGAISNFVTTHQQSFPDVREIRVVHSNLIEAKRLEDTLSALSDLDGSSDTDKSSNGQKRRTSAKDDENEPEACPICLDDLTGAVSLKTLACNHAFHQACIDRAFSVSKKCPMCMRYYGKPEGTQPRNATMISTISRHRLPGYSCETIVIEYRIPGGTQGPEHPHPGQRYHGTSRTAYLPHNTEGRSLLLLLRKAFDARLTFTIGRSVTSGMENCVTWNDIHHKTSMHGGPTSFGYPDPGYLTRLKMELADKGITPDDA